MSVVIPTVGEIKLLSYMLGKQTPTTFLAKLFVNDYVPVEGTTAVHLTEMNTHSYAAKTLVLENWAISHPSLTADGGYPLLAWTFTAGTAVDVQGYYVMDPDGTLLWAERFDTPKTVGDSGDQIRVTVKVQLGQSNT